MGASIKQIAEMSGVSRGTVDRALNDRPGIRPEVKEHVLKIAADLGYRSNRAGKLLGLHKTPLKIGIQMPSEGNDFFDSIVDGQNSALNELVDFGLTLVRKTMKGFSAAKQAGQIKELLEEGAQALALVPIDDELIHRLLLDLFEQGIPVVTFNTDVEQIKRLCYVGNDYLKSGATAAGLLGRIADGRPYKVLILTGSVRMLGHNQRIHGFHKVVKSNYKNISIADIFETEDDDDTAYEIVKGFLNRTGPGDNRADQESIDAIYITAGGASGCCRAVIEAGLEGKVKIISFDRTGSMEKYIRNRVITASIEQEPFVQGYMPVKILFDYLLDSTVVPESHWTRNEIVISENM